MLRSTKLGALIDKVEVSSHPREAKKVREAEVEGKTGLRKRNRTFLLPWHLILKAPLRAAKLSVLRR